MDARQRQYRDLMDRPSIARRLAGVLAWLIFAGLSPAFAAQPPKKEARKEAVEPIAEAKSAAQIAEGVAQSVQPELKLAAASAALLDSFTGQFLYAKNDDARQYPASSTKILTALVIIESGSLEKVVTIDPTDTQIDSPSGLVKPGEQYSRLQLLYGLMLRSANDNAIALARDNAGSVEAFAGKMNQRASELGATSSHFDNPNGLPDPNHYTTAHDLALIARAAMQQPFFRQLVSTVYYPWRFTSGKVYVLRNHNRLLRHYAGCNGIKTGYTVAAQQVLVSSALRDGHEVISVVLHTNKPGIWDDSKELLTYGLIKLGVPAESIVDTSDRNEPIEPDEGQGQ